MVAIGSSLDGHGADLLRATMSFANGRQSLELEALDGRTGTSRWRTEVSLAPSWEVYLVAEDLDGDGCSDLLFSRLDPNAGWQTELLIDGRTGQQQW